MPVKSNAVANGINCVVGSPYLFGSLFFKKTLYTF